MSDQRSLLELATDEMKDRLTNEARRRAMPDYTLARVIGILEKTTSPVADDETEEPDFLDIVTASGLPIEKKREMLAEELTRLYERRQKILDAVEALNASEEQEAAEVLVHEVR